MWMMNGGDNNEPNMNDFFNPEPNTTTFCTNTTVTPSPHVGLKDHFAKTSCDQQGSGREFKEQAEIMGGSRWNPTAEQLLALEEKYRCGTRTPTTDQIQQIASELRRFGKIEGKNVFYWFQNHKARERQKRRRRQAQQKHNDSDHESLKELMKESELRRTVDHGLDQTKNLVTHSNCSEHVEGAVSVHGAAIAESGTNGWSEFEEKELQQMNSSSLDMHAMWHTMDLFSTPPVHHFKSNMTTTTSKFSSLKEHSSLLRPRKRESHANHEDEIREVQTLQLFPLCSDNCNGANGTEKDRLVPIRTINTNFSPSQFFEFLPLKN